MSERNSPSATSGTCMRQAHQDQRFLHNTHDTQWKTAGITLPAGVSMGKASEPAGSLSACMPAGTTAGDNMPKGGDIS